MEFKKKAVYAALFYLLVSSWGLFPQNTASVYFSECADGAFDMAGFAGILSGVETSELTYTERQGLLMILEEEKLLRDISLSLGNKWGMRIFSEIAKNEETHIELMRVFMQRYEYPDPFSGYEAGKFKNPDMQGLYNDLIVRGSRSAEDALATGAFIEELDIYDLRALIKQTAKGDLKILYLNLEKGSRIHLCALSRELKTRGRLYKPVYIDENLYDKIISDRKEKKGLIANYWYWFGRD